MSRTELRAIVSLASIIGLRMLGLFMQISHSTARKQAT
jgi:hypothetical protein